MTVVVQEEKKKTKPSPLDYLVEANKFLRKVDELREEERIKKLKMK
ncbi:MAG: hypothetical protein GY853_15850 [PVC group bacterium]|nr:hypothetical protein [PVC group bacterium]